MKASKAVRKVRARIKKKEWLYEVIASKANDNTPSPRLIELFSEMANRYAKKKHHNRYPYADDMIAYAMMMFCQHWWRFNPEKSDNAFAYYVTCVHSYFVQFICREKKQTEIKKEYKEYLDCEQHF